ncbi:type 4a pilus biogenesis protein PilO [Photobacterium sp.]|uniref:type 4a pilus biogenesis protein PilO n=1 Tax=Photobacterium sp. TaxID=660 RepID=UPI00299DBE7B|nr:type 4a pilus biogenesis protein PilO [Photobacterium sp.]MDX1302592.1 type 4a pilus biogenesis protein PilO [Photobacterium sp.]
MSDWHDLDLDEITDWPIIPQSVVVLFLALVVAAVGYWYWLTPLQHELVSLKQQEMALRVKLIDRAAQVAELPTLKKQIEELEQRYHTVINQLPVEKELASLLSGINDIGIRNGLEFQRIQWAPRIELQWYYELPLNMQLTGSYEEIGQFAASIAKLSRIVTLKDFDLKVVEQTGQQETLSLKVSASTYRFKASE